MNERIARTLTGQIVVRIREKILAGEYAPGAPLLQDSIAAEFGVSKIPVREALVQLRADGLVDIFAHRGFQVRPLSAEEVSEVFSLRLAIEPDAVGRGAKLARAEDIATAKSALAVLSASLALGELSRSGDLNTAFHTALIVPSRQPVTAEALSRLHTMSQRYIRMHLKPRGRARRAAQEHTALFQAWSARRAREARNLAEAHIRETQDELAAALRASA
ncbi:MAG TPA: GntR family transcriptional regulator [Steroidobacteraceae bacterium]|nr:GntR family transcriptional regulator [Steroidobacteraceae bacterium]